MSEENVLLDVYQRLGSIEAKVDDVREIRDKANEANTVANKALQIAERVEEEVDEMQAEQTNNRRWLVGIIVSTIFSILGVIFAVLSVI